MIRELYSTTRLELRKLWKRDSKAGIWPIFPLIVKKKAVPQPSPRAGLSWLGFKAIFHNSSVVKIMRILLMMICCVVFVVDLLPFLPFKARVVPAFS